MVPNLIDAHIYLLVAYARTNQVPEEIRECRRVLQTLPDHFGANLNLGKFLAQSGDLQGAIAPLQKAESLRPDDPIPHMYLADTLAKLGRNEEAQQERAKAESLGAVPVGDPPPDSDQSQPQ
jgi:Flp pilus assembly protein TadD